MVQKAVVAAKLQEAITRLAPKQDTSSSRPVAASSFSTTKTPASKGAHTASAISAADGDENEAPSGQTNPSSHFKPPQFDPKLGVQAEKQKQEKLIQAARQMADDIFQCSPPVFDVSTVPANSLAAKIDTLVDDHEVELRTRCDGAIAAFVAAAQGGPYFRSVQGAHAATAEFTKTVDKRLVERLTAIREQCIRSHHDAVAAAAQREAAQRDAAAAAQRDAAQREAARAVVMPDPNAAQSVYIPQLQSHSAAAAMSTAEPSALPALAPAPVAAPAAAAPAALPEQLRAQMPGAGHVHGALVPLGVPMQGVSGHESASSQQPAPWGPHAHASGSPLRGSANRMVAEWSNSALQIQHASMVPFASGGLLQSPIVPQHRVHDNVMQSMQAYVGTPSYPPAQTILQLLQSWMTSQGIPLDLLTLVESSAFGGLTDNDKQGMVMLKDMQVQLIKRRTAALEADMEKQQREEQKKFYAEQMQQALLQQHQQQQQQQQQQFQLQQLRHQFLHQYQPQPPPSQQLRMPMYQQQFAPSFPQQLSQTHFFPPGFHPNSNSSKPS